MTDNTASSTWTAPGPGWGEGVDRKIIKLYIDCRKRSVSIIPLASVKDPRRDMKVEAVQFALCILQPPRLPKLGSSRSPEINCWQKAEHWVTKHCSFWADRILTSSRKVKCSSNWNTKGLKNYGDRNPPSEQETGKSQHVIIICNITLLQNH